MNFGEAIAYWYLRLNGFFPLSNFVHHRGGNIPRDADADVLAVRFPYVVEEIGGQAEDWDNGRFDEWQLGHREKTVCVICEVKSGGYSGESVVRNLSGPRVGKALKRFGILPQHQVISIAEKLKDRPSFSTDVATFAKVLMAESSACTSRNEMPPCLHIELSHAVRFIRERMQKYRYQKNAARMFFPNEIIQLLAWEAGLELEH